MSNRPSNAADQSSSAERAQGEPTGVPNLDVVLGGGLPRGTLAIVMGPPGSGKTTLANQIAFAAAHRGRRGVVVSAISEPTSKLIAHLRAFSFYDDTLVGDSIQFLSLEQFLPQGLRATSDELIGIARQTRADFVVLDGFRGVRGADIDMQAARQFLYDVGTTLSALGVTTLITSEADPRDPAFFPETTTADIIIGLYYTVAGVQQRRAVEVIKMRGAEPMPGLHGFAITADGTRIFPRLEARMTSGGDALAPEVATPAVLAQVDESPDGKASFDVPELDELLDGGLTRGTNTLIVGSLGTGKTLLALHFAAAGLRQGEQTLFLGFRESTVQLLQKASGFTFGQSLREALASGGPLAIHRWAPIELKPDILADHLLATLDRMQTRRLIIDSIAEIESAVSTGRDDKRLANFIAALMEALRTRNITSLFIKEHRTTVATELDLAAGPTSVLAENVLLLQQIEQGAQLQRVLTVVKTRFSPHSSQMHEFAIRTPEGIQMLGTFTRAGGAETIASTESTRPASRSRGNGQQK